MLGIAKHFLQKRKIPRPEQKAIPKILSDDQRQSWRDGGYVVLEKFFSDQEINKYSNVVDQFWQESRSADSNITTDIFLGPKEKRVKLHQAPDEARYQPYKMNDLYLESQQIRELILSDQLSAILSELLDGFPLVCNTLNFEFGSEQVFHTDSLYMTPPKDLNLVATWIALEDTQDDAGPLCFYPGSHKIAPYHFSNGKMTAVPSEMENYATYMQSEVKRLGLKSQRFAAKKGDVFIWHSQLFHGGAPIKNRKLTRRSLVTHYFKYGDLDCDAVKQGPYGYWMRRAPQPVPQNNH